MSFPAEFNYTDEADFIARFLVPLLGRLGFSIVVPYHGSTEYGKDLVFGEIDRFGHVCYYGLQAKYVPSIGLGFKIEDLIVDARQAFRHSFTHPSTNLEHRISRFYAVNGGSISDQARPDFFNALPEYVGMVRLMDGKELIALDRTVAQARLNDVSSMLTGIRMEISFNRWLFNGIVPTLDGHILDTPVKSAPATRFRTDAISGFVSKPFATDKIPLGAMFDYLKDFGVINEVLDTLSNGGGEFRMGQAARGYD